MEIGQFLLSACIVCVAALLWVKALLRDLLYDGAVRRAAVTGVAGLALMAVPIGMGVHGAGQHMRLETACGQAPTMVDDTTLHRYAGQVVAPPSPRGVVGTYAPRQHHLPTVFVRIDRAADQQYPGATVALRGLRSVPPTGSRVTFCAQAADPVYWWPRIGHQGGPFGGATYGQPTGPFAAAHWIADLPTGASRAPAADGRQRRHR